jgi:hypothetical protein
MKAIQTAFRYILFNRLANRFRDSFEISFVGDRCQRVELDYRAV